MDNVRDAFWWVAVALGVIAWIGYHFLSPELFFTGMGYAALGCVFAGGVICVIDWLWGMGRK